MPHTDDKSILIPGSTCWRIEEAERIAFLIDGAAYYEAFRKAVLNARHSILILGWDIDSRLQLLRNGSDDGYPVELGPFLNAVVEENQDLHVRILTWDFAMIYALEREWLPLFKLNWRTHRRITFRMHNHLPLGASFHQKLVVIDDTLAFIGGLDLSKRRWDTPEHLPDNPYRIDPNGSGYPPFHDVQAMLTGKAATSLGDLARMHWQQVTGKRLKSPGLRNPADYWPNGRQPDLAGIRVGIARTLPAYGGMPETRESEQLYLTAIRHARHTIYIENQYLTSQSIGDALSARLKSPGGPEIVVVLPFKANGWLEQGTMDVLRGRMLKRLRAADHEGRLRIWYPHIPSDNGQSLMVHSKIMIVDDCLLRIGSSNASNRSMGLDTECDLAVESGRPDDAAAITAFRNRLLAEHLDCTAETVSNAIAQTGSLIGGIESLRGPGRSLYEMGESLDANLDAMLPRDDLLDPERPMNADTLIDYFIRTREHRSVNRQLLLGGITMFGLLLIALAWYWTPVSHWLPLPPSATITESLRLHPATPLLVVAAFVISGFLFVPPILPIIACAWIFGPVSGFVYAMLGAFTGAISTYGVGRTAGRDRIQRLTSSRINLISRHLVRQGLLTMIMARIIPIAPFTIINMVAGASHIRWRDFVLGTLIGTTPGIVAIVIIADRLKSAMQNPQPETFTLMALVIAAIALATLMLRQWLIKRQKRKKI